MGFTSQQIVKLREQIMAFRHIKSGTPFPEDLLGKYRRGEVRPAASGTPHLLQKSEQKGLHAARLGPVTPVAAWRPRLAVASTQAGPIAGRSMLLAHEVQQLLRENSMEMGTLLQALVTYAAILAKPYLSGFYVGAVGLGGTGRIYFGANMEFPGTTLASSVHAEQCLIANLLRHNEETLVSVAISAPPCGHCRQFMSELGCADTVQLIFGEGPSNTYRLEDILPHRFGPHDLLTEEMPLLLQKQHHDLAFTQGARADLNRRKDDGELQKAAAEALQAAMRSYSPYTQSPSAVTLISEHGMHTGAIVENAAHNPTLQPLQAAFTAAMLDGVREYSQVKEAVLVELEDHGLRQMPTAVTLLAAVAPSAKFNLLPLHRLPQH